jgi:alkanesulfonate monooxygenase SsuD/methylene tetrahydromethanopterin reductase-like flavin-dependent oxidoreductase (luciferase family)
VWIGGGSSLISAELAGRLGLGLLLPSVLAPPEAFSDQVAHYRETFEPAPGGFATPTVGACSHVHVGPDPVTARQRWEPYHMGYLHWLGELVRWGGGTPRPATYETMLAGPSVCGDAAEVAERLAAMDHALGLDVHLAMFDHGGLPAELLDETLTRYATEVAPLLAAGHSGPGQARSERVPGKL